MTIRTEVVDDKACYDDTYGGSRRWEAIKLAMTIRTEVVGDKACYDDTYGGSSLP